MFELCRKAVSVLPFAALALLGACSGGGDAPGAPQGTVEAEVVTVTPVYRLVPDVQPPHCAGADATGAQKSCGAAEDSARREPDGFDVAYRYGGSLHHTHTDYRPGEYMQVSAQPRQGGGGTARGNP